GIAVGVIAVLVKTLGKFSMVIVGLMSVGVCQFFKSSTPMSSSSGPRGGLEHAGGLSIGAAVGAFIFGVALVLLIPVSGGASSNHQKANPKFVPVHSKDLKFHLYIPEPIIKEKHLESENGLTIPYDVVGWNNDDPLRRRELAMAYEVLPSAQDMAKAKGLTNSALNTLFPGQVYYYLDGEKGLDGVVDSLRKRSGITVDHVCSVGLQNKYPGREVEGTISDGSGRIARTRIFLIDNQIVIQLCVAGEPDWVNSNDAYKFFDSLAIDR
ncbi:MAG: hypothetical protein K2Z81_05790, partial [Cyanobacteria bacterium]|nr:hypothetical protein [Cyanobacteriota bacterium]